MSVSAAPTHHAPFFLDCCGLVRRVLRDMKEELGFTVGPWNQAYQVITTHPSQSYVFLSQIMDHVHKTKTYAIVLKRLNFVYCYNLALPFIYCLASLTPCQWFCLDHQR